MASQAELDKILDFLQTVYRFRLEPKMIPTALKGPFSKAVERFKDQAELKKIDTAKMGICEEVADVAYQTLKLVCLQNKILTEETIQTLQNHLKNNNFYDGSGRLVGLNYADMEALSGKLVPGDLIEETQHLVHPAAFLPKDGGKTIIRDFLAGQFVAYISRLWRGHKAGGLQTIEYIRDEKIPEETQELAEALVKSGGNLEDLEINLALATNLVGNVKITRETRDAFDLFAHIAIILKTKMAKPVTVEDTLHLMFLKMKGRQEMDFYGVDEKSIRLTCKPVEYLIEADMFL